MGVADNSYKPWIIKSSTWLYISNNLVKFDLLLNAFTKFESVKRTIRPYKSRGIERSGHPENAGCKIIPDKYIMIRKGEAFQFFDLGFGDERRMIIFEHREIFRRELYR